MNRRVSRAGLLAAAVLASPCISWGTVSGSTYTYNGPMTGTGNAGPLLNDPTVWTGGVVPPASDSTTQLVFTDVDSNAYSVQNNIAGPLLVNSIVLNTFTAGASFGFANTPGDSLELTGASPSITDSGPTPTVNIGLYSNGGSGNGLVLAPNSGTTTFNGSGNGTLSFGNNATTIVGTGGIVIAETGLGTVQLFSNSSSPNTFTGGVTLDSGSLQLGSASAIAGNTLTINGGTIRGAAGGATVANNIVANADLVQASGSGLVLSGTISGSGGVRLYNGEFNAGASLTLGGVDVYAGATSIDAAPLRVAALQNSTLTFSAAGSALDTPSVTIGQGGTLAFSGASTAQRLPATVPVTLNNAQILTTNTSTTTSFAQTLGNATMTGLNIFTFNGASSAGSAANSLALGALTPADNATLFFRGSWNGTTAAGTTAAATFNNANGYFTPIADPAGSAIPVVPLASGSPAAAALTPATLVTYNAAGITLVNPTDPSIAQLYDGGAFGTATAHQNVNVAGTTTGATVTVSGVNPINALILSGAGIGNTVLTGSGSLNVYSGDVVETGTVSINGVTINFGTAKGYIHVGTNLYLTGGSSINGSGGLVVDAPSSQSLAAGNLALEATDASNPFTGGLFINGQATVSYLNDAQLGASGQPVTLNGGEIEFNPGVAGGTIAFGRPLRIGASGGGIFAGYQETISVTSDITGPGAFSLVTGAAGIGTTVLSGNNSYAGPTFIFVGTLNIASDANLGVGPVIFGGGAGSGTLQFSAPDTFAHPVTFYTGGNIDTGANNVALAGQLTGAVNGETIIKTGSGTLSITAADPLLSNTINVSAGVLSLTGAGSFSQIENAIVGSGAEFRLDNSGTNLNDRYSDYGRVAVAGGGLFHLIGNAAANTTETFGGLNLSSGGAATVQVDNGAGHSAVLTSAGYAYGPGTLTKTGTGTLVLANTSSTWTGGTQISGGTLSIANDAALGAPCDGSIGIYLTYGGSGYTSYPNVTVSGGGGGSVGTITTTYDTTFGGSGSILSLTLYGSSGFTSVPTVTIEPPAGGTAPPYNTATASAYLTGAVTLDGGTLQTTAPVTSGRFFILTANNGAIDTAGQADSITGLIEGPGGLTVASSTPGGLLTLSNTNTYAGTTTIQSGATVIAQTPSALGTGTVVLAGGVLELATATTGGGPVSIANAVTASATGSKLVVAVLPGSTTATVGAVTVNAGAKLALSASGATAIPGVVLQPASLTFATGSNGNFLGTLDIGANDLDISAASLWTVNQAVASGYNLAGGGKWNGTGITSSAAAGDTRHLTAVGVIDNTSPTGLQLYGSGGVASNFDGASPAAGDILVKYTYFGDANLDGKVDGSDYSLIDAGYAADKQHPGTATGWYNGDFNYDGVIDGTDYALIDNAFNNQTSVLAGDSAVVATATEQVAAPAAVPEPAMAAVAVWALALGVNRRRKFRKIVPARGHRATAVASN